MVMEGVGQSIDQGSSGRCDGDSESKTTCTWFLPQELCQFFSASQQLARHRFDVPDVLCENSPL